MLVLLARVAAAEESTFEGAKKPEAEATKAEAHAAAELGGILVFGNTETMALTGQGTVSYKLRRNQLSGTFGVNWGQSKIDADADGKLSASERETDYVQTAGREYGTLRYDRFLTQKDSLYVLGGGFTDTFAGYDYRVNGQVGWSHAFVDIKKSALKAEIGMDVAQEDFVDGVDPAQQTVVSARAQVGWRYNFNDHVSFEDTVEAYESVLDFTDVRINNTAAVSATLTNRLALKLSHQLAFDNVPVEGYQPLDHTTLATVVFTVL